MKISLTPTLLAQGTLLMLSESILSIVNNVKTFVVNSHCSFENRVQMEVRPLHVCQSLRERIHLAGNVNPVQDRSLSPEHRARTGIECQWRSVSFCKQPHSEKGP
ncbi:hypothetical protein DFJ58DRAFT_780519 [Suillus subalutaceus]|uniref:uncharacterized protein n=1 Tax=Suillus subalutaceus TaxID=48586 RepID=UPI001B85D23F|nr:uncharacterized protein DFJ58DRAFT_780519 [Suillus subalutaceus]KAG1859611.1 hypothetical protein DFJ58DRAFT_780519 [Suillus subalutaceus]